MPAGDLPQRERRIAQTYLVEHEYATVAKLYLSKKKRAAPKKKTAKKAGAVAPVATVKKALPAKTKITKAATLKRSSPAKSAKAPAKAKKAPTKAAVKSLPAKRAATRVALSAATPFVAPPLVPVKEDLVSQSITARMPNGHRHTFAFLVDTSTVGALKNALQATTGVPAAVQRLVGAGRELTPDASPLSALGIRAGAHVYVLVRQPSTAAVLA